MNIGRFAAAAAGAIMLAGSVGASAFSDEYEPYYPHITAWTRSVDEIYNRISGTQQLPEVVVNTRHEVIRMYKDVGIDISLDMENWLDSYRMISDMPQRWSIKTPKPLFGDYSQVFSIDAPFNNKIPKDAPKVLIPREVLSFKALHIGVVKANIDGGGWGTGLPQIVSTSADPYMTIAAKYQTGNINKVFRVRTRENLYDYMNNAQTGDEHAIFIDDESKTAMQTWLTRVPNDPRGYSLSSGLLPGFDIRSSASSIMYKLDGIGAEGKTGVNAAGCITNAYTIKSSEISDPNRLIEHALGGAITNMVSARVFPSNSVDAHMAMSEGHGSDGMYNTGAVPYGGIIQLDSKINLDSLYENEKISLHAYKILRAMQEYGFYNIDTSGGSFFFYTSTYSKDWINSDVKGFNVPFSNNNQGFDHVVKELQAFFDGNEFFGTGLPKVFCTIPVVKYASLDVNADGIIDGKDYTLVKKHIGSEYNEDTKIYDINQDNKITPEDLEKVYNYLNDLPAHTFTWYDIAFKDNDSTNGRILASGTKRGIEGVEKFREGMLVSIAAIPNNGYEFDCWTGDFEGIESSVVQITMDRDYTIGAKYKKSEDVSFTVKVAGLGHVETSDNGIVYNKPDIIYGKNTLLTIKAVPDEGYEFCGWQGDLAGYSNPANFLIEENCEIVANFGKIEYKENFLKEDWVPEDLALTKGSYKITENGGISFSDFNQSNALLINKSQDIDLKGDYAITFTMKNTTTIENGNKGKFVFNYINPRNYYYLTLGGRGEIVAYKVYEGINTELAKYKGSLEIDGVYFDKLPITIQIVRQNNVFSVYGYKDNKKIIYFEKIRDKSISGGTIGTGSMHNGILTVSGINIYADSPDASKAIIQEWSPEGNTDPWLNRLSGAVAVAIGSPKAYANDNYTVISEDNSICPYINNENNAMYVPVKYVAEKLGAKVVYDNASGETSIEYSGNRYIIKENAEEKDGVLYIDADSLAEILNKKLYVYKDVMIFSDTVDIYTPASEPECIEFCRKTFGLQYYM